MRIDARSAVLALFATSACGGAAATQAPIDKARGVPVRTAEVLRQDLNANLALTGTLHPRAQVQVVAEVAARLLRIEHDEGASVAAGDTLAVLDDTDYRLSHERARAALAVADANRAHAAAEWERAINLLKTGGITDKDHLAAQVGLQVAEASLAQVRAETAIAAQQLSRCAVKAPFAGRVARRLVDPGAMLATGTPLLTLVDDSVLEFRAAVPSADYGKIKIGATVEVTVDGRTPHPGRVARINPLVEERTRAFDVVVAVPGGPGLVGGLFARATVRVGHVTGALVVPPAALIRDGSQPNQADTFVVAGGKAERRSVTLGVEGPAAIQITDGLQAGDLVVLDPPTALASGAPVDVQSGATR